VLIENRRQRCVPYVQSPIDRSSAQHEVRSGLPRPYSHGRRVNSTRFDGSVLRHVECVDSRDLIIAPLGGLQPE
jgi:hypothetical protein